MKKKRPVLFPENETINVLPNKRVENLLKELCLGHLYRIALPSTLHYQYISPMVNPKEMTIGELENFNAIKGMLVKVSSIIQMVNGSKIAVLRQYQDKLILNRYDKVFALFDMSAISGEIIQLDLETRQALNLITA